MILAISILFIIELYLFEFFSNKRVKNFLTIIVFALLIIVMGANTQNPDTHIYEEYIYNNEEFFSKDFGFGILVYIFKAFKLDYYYLKMFVAIVGFMLINSTLKKYICDYKMFFILYLIYPFFFDVVQVRNFLAMSIFIYAIPFLLEDTKRGNIKYVITVLIAATMQKTALVYLPIIFVKKLNNQKYYKFFGSIIIFVSIVIAINRPFLNMFIDMLKNSVSDVLSGIAPRLNITTNWGWLVQWGIQFGNFFFVKEGARILKNFYNNDDEKVVKFAKLIENINYYMFIFLPLYVLTPTFSRIIRNLLILNYIVYVNVCFLIRKVKKVHLKKYYGLYMLLVFIFEIVFFIGQYIYSQSGYFSDMIYPILTENWILY